MAEDVRVRNQSDAVTPTVTVVWREIDAAAAEVELRLRLPQVERALADNRRAKAVTQQTLQYKFSI